MPNSQSWIFKQAFIFDLMWCISVEIHFYEPNKVLINLDRDGYHFYALQAWDLQPEKRPTFRGVKDELGQLKSKTVWTYEVQLVRKRNGNACLLYKSLFNNIWSHLWIWDNVALQWLVANVTPCCSSVL